MREMESFERIFFWIFFFVSKGLRRNSHREREFATLRSQRKMRRTIIACLLFIEVWKG